MSERPDLEAIIRQFIPDGFRDEDGVWREGPHQADALAELAQLREQLERGEGVWDMTLETLEATRAQRDRLEGYYEKASAERDTLRAAAEGLADALDRLMAIPEVDEAWAEASHVLAAYRKEEEK